MKDSLRLAFGGIEMANHRLGPWLDLDGWAAQCSDQLPKWEPALSRIYRKYCRRRSMSPESEIILGIVSSMGMHHCRKTFSRGVASDMGFGRRHTTTVHAGAKQDTQEDSDEDLPPRSGD
jgi:hypothetical protein